MRAFDTAAAAGVAMIVASAWATASTFVLSMPLAIQYFTRLAAISLFLGALYSTVQIALFDRASVIVAALELLGGLWIVAIGYLFSWPSMTVWASSLVSGLSIAATAAYHLYWELDVDADSGGVAA